MRKSPDGPFRLAFIPPLVPSPAEAPPAGDGWIHEVKFDGYRTQLVVDGDRVRAFSRNGHDWTDKYWPVALAAEKLPCTAAVIDGEVIVNGAGGISDFSALGRAIGKEPGRLLFVGFDLLHLDGRDLRSLPLVERKAALRQLLAGVKGPIQYSEHFETEGAGFFRACDGMGLEGIVSKRAASRYRSGPSKDWLKVKCFAEAEFDVLGVVRKPGEAPMALVADRERQRVGSAFVTLDRAAREKFWRRVESMKAARAPAGIKKKPGAEWVRPGLVARVKYLKGEGGLRHASLKHFHEVGQAEG